MNRQRISTTVDHDLLGVARQLDNWKSDAELFDAALRALLARRRATEIDDAYGAYELHPIGEPDAWGDLESFHAAAHAS